MTNEKAPERIWLGKLSTKSDMLSMTTRDDKDAIEYVRADLLATARKTVLREVISLVMQRGEILHRGNLVTALEAATENRKGEG